MLRLQYIILYIALAVHASAQVKVTGRVIDLQQKPVSDVIVKLVSGSKTLAFTSSNAKGEYSLELKNVPSGEVSLQFTHISYEKESERMSSSILNLENFSLKAFGASFGLSKILPAVITLALCLLVALLRRYSPVLLAANLSFFPLQRV